MVCAEMGGKFRQTWVSAVGRGDAIKMSKKRKLRDQDTVDFLK